MVLLLKGRKCLLDEQIKQLFMEKTMQTFQDYAYYYNTFYQDKDYKAEAMQIDNLLKTYGSDISSIINFGCGTGKHDIELAKMAYQCAGIDMSPLMIDIAQENVKKSGKNIDFSIADIRNFESQAKYDAVISLFHVMSYQTKNQDIISAFRSARKAIGEGGLFVFDVWYGPGVLSDKPCERVKEIEDEKNRLVRIARPVMHDKENVVDVCYEVFVMDREAGFELLDNLDCQTLGEKDYNSWTSYFIARAL